MLLSFFLSLPLWLSGMLMVGGMVALGWGVAEVCHALVQRHEGMQRACKGMVPPVGAAMTAGCFLWLSFFTSAEMHDVNVAVQAVQAEAKAVQHLSDLNGLAQSGAVQGRFSEALQHYVQAVVNQEWVRMSRQESAPEARAALLQVRALGLQGFVADSANLQSSLLQHVRDLGQARDLRLSVAEERMPVLAWLASLGSILIVLLYAGLLHAGNGQRSSARLICMLLAGMLGLHLYTVSVLAQPFVGRIAVSPAPIAQALSVP